MHFCNMPIPPCVCWQAAAAKYGTVNQETKNASPEDKLRPDTVSEQGSSNTANEMHAHHTQQASEVSGNVTTEGAAVESGGNRDEAQACPTLKHNSTEKSQDSEELRHHEGPNRKDSVSEQKSSHENRAEGENVERLKAEVTDLRQENIVLGEAVQELRRQLADLAKENETFLNGACKQHRCTCKGSSDRKPGDDMQNESNYSDRHDAASEKSRQRNNYAEPAQQPSRLSLEEQVGSAPLIPMPSSVQGQTRNQ